MTPRRIDDVLTESWPSGEGPNPLALADVYTVDLGIRRGGASEATHRRRHHGLSVAYRQP